MSVREDKELTENENWRVHDFLDSKYSENVHTRELNPATEDVLLTKLVRI